MRIAILHEASITPATLSRYTVATLDTLWRQAGHEVIHLYGPRSYVGADLVLVHVDLSIVPKAYLDLARRYPVALNARITDICKRRISRNLLQAHDAYAGPVIVKSDLNHAGWPETKATVPRPRWLRWKKQPVYTRFEDPLDYPIYASIAEVPAPYWRDPLLVVEKFLPEYEKGFYHVRLAFFLGDRHRSWRLRLLRPVLRDHSILDDVEIPTPEYIDRYRREIGLDYGKIDFVEHDGKITILDVNKTIGTPAPPATTPYLAPAIESFFPASV